MGRNVRCGSPMSPRICCARSINLEKTKTGEHLEEDVDLEGDEDGNNGVNVDKEACNRGNKANEESANDREHCANEGTENLTVKAF